MSDLTATIEAELRALPARLNTKALVARIADAAGEPQAAVYKRLLALAPRCPAARQDKDHAFVRYGRTCYPWVWGPLAHDQPLQGPPVAVLTPPPGQGIALDDGTIERLAARIVHLLRETGDLSMASVGGETGEPELCLICSTTKPASEFGLSGICRTCETEEV